MGDDGREFIGFSHITLYYGRLFLHCHDDNLKAKEAGLPIIAMEQINEIDLYIDGADEITPDLTLLKGRGYDLVREKLLARSAKKFIVIADESKIVENIGDNFPVPSEVQPFAWELVKNILMKKGTGDIRINSAKDGYAITSCGNFVLDFNYTEKNIEKLNALLCQTPGIVEHGIFYNIAHGALISSNGKVREIWKN